MSEILKFAAVSLAYTVPESFPTVAVVIVVMELATGHQSTTKVPNSGSVVQLFSVLI